MVVIIVEPGPPFAQVFTGAVIVSPLLISIIWCLYNSIPPILLFTYAIAGRKYILSFMCFLAMIVSTAAVIASLGFVWCVLADQPARHDLSHSVDSFVKPSHSVKSTVCNALK